MVVNKQTFTKLEGKESNLIQLVEEREDIIKIDPVQVLVRLKEMRAEIDKIPNSFGAIIEKLRMNIKNHNIDLATMKKAKAELGLDIEFPDPIDEKEILGLMDIDKYL